MTNPIPYYMSQRDYYSRKDPRYKSHLANIEANERIDRRIDASASDHSYSVIITQKEMIK